MVTTQKIALIWPYGFDPNYTIPLAFGSLKSNLVSTHYDVRLFDGALTRTPADSMAFRDFLIDFSPSIVGVSSWSLMFNEALSVLRVAKETLPGVITLVGGVHATSYFNRVMENRFIDYLFYGEAELTFPIFLEQLRAPRPNFALVKGLVYRNVDGTLTKTESLRLDNLDPIRWPDYDFMRLNQYHKRGYRVMTPEKKNAPIWTTRGCPYRCTFCSAPIISGRHIRKHGTEYLMDWISFLYYEKGIRWVNVIDDNFTFDIEHAKNFCRAVIAQNFKGLRFGTPNGVRMQRGAPELWRLMRQAGWSSVVVAPESGSPQTLKNMKKDLPLDKVPGIVQDIKRAGLEVIGFFILGYPGDTRDDIDQTIRFMKKIDFDYVGISNFQPLPGTPIYDQLVAAGEIPDGMLPGNYTAGTRVYTPSGLKDINFPLLFFKTYLLLVMRRPRLLLRMLQYYHLKILLSKLVANVVHTFTARLKLKALYSARP